jgi:hypothetical protein
MRRAELTAWWDRALMATYERLLLPEQFRLHHQLNLMRRLERRPFDLDKTGWSHRIQLFRRFRRTAIWRASPRRSTSPRAG